MKELSIEEKAKRYDEAINAIKKLKKNHPTALVIKDWIKENFPELAESEDERIRKSIIKFLIDVNNGAYTKSELEIASWVAWLENQGEYSNFRNKIQIGDKVTRNEDGVLVNLSQLKRIAKPAEKQGEQNDSDVKDYNSIDPHFAKPIDKVEPKFRKGEWITNGDYTWKIVEVKPLDYILQSQDGNIVDDTISHVDEQFHSFTIEDAKDGDVLYLQKDGKEHIIIYKGVIKERFRTFVSAYCAYNSIVDAFCFADVSRYVDIAYGGIMPATKEQRNLLFQKMHEAGYEWDADKKELKKIEQKPTEDVDLPEFESYLCLMFQKFRTKGMCTNGEIIDYVKEHSQKLRDILVKLTWDEEDENRFNNLIFLVECSNENEPTKKGFINFINRLKSLKDKVQPKKEWSEEDEKIVIQIRDAVEDYFPTTVADKIKNWLKSLRPQNRWRPSEGQIEALESATANCAYSEYQDCLRELIGQLKKLKG